MVRWGAVFVAFGVAAPSPALAGGLDVRAWLDRPGVKLLAVELYATWCKPCMKAVPRWKALHERYRSEGLRLVVIATQDPQAGCVNPGWNPDEVVCDEEGVIAEALGAGDRLPAAFLWSWQGRLLVRNGHVDGVEQAIQDWMRAAPRVDVEIGRIAAGAGIGPAPLRDLVRAKLRDTNKLDVVATEEERAQLLELKARSIEMGFDESLQCEIGKDLPANSMLTAQVSGGRSSRLQLMLLSAERGCLVASSVVGWNKKNPSGAVAEGVAELLGKLRTKIQMPKGAARPGARRPPVAAEGKLGDTPVAWEPEPDAKQVVVRFDSQPPGAVVLVDGKLECKDTPCSRELPTGSHTVSMQRQRHVERSESIRIFEAGEISWKLEPDFGWLDVTSVPAGIDVKLDGKVVGKTPLVGFEVSPGTHAVLVSDPCHHEAGERVAVERATKRAVHVTPPPRQGAIRVRAKDGRTDDAVQAEVRVDGELVGKTPGTFKVSICAKRVEVRGPTGTWAKNLSVPERKTVDVVALLAQGAREPEARGAAIPVTDPDMMLVPEGEFLMGCAVADTDCDDDEKPPRKVWLRAFQIDRTEVTVGQYAKCVKAGACMEPKSGGGQCNWKVEGRQNHPVNCVDWHQAAAYCAWAKMRLPTEAEWEKAARGTDGGIWPAGEVPTCRHAIMDESGTGCGVRHTWAVGTRPDGASPYGALDMAGNVWEWVADWYGAGYYKDAPGRDPKGPERGVDRVYRGGSWNDGVPWMLRASERNRARPRRQYSGLGFRCARSTP